MKDKKMKVYDKWEVDEIVVCEKCGHVGSSMHKDFHDKNCCGNDNENLTCAAG